MTMIGRAALGAVALAMGLLGATVGSSPASADVCDQLAARVAELTNDENRLRDAVAVEVASDAGLGRRPEYSFTHRLQQTIARRRAAERQYARKGCGDRGQQAAQQPAVDPIAPAIAAGAIGGFLGGLGAGGGGYGRSGSGYSGGGGRGYSGGSYGSGRRY